MDLTENKDSLVDLQVEAIGGAVLHSKEVQTTITLLDDLPSKSNKKSNSLIRSHLHEVNSEINPKCEGEMQLYLVLERANLLEYFNTFVSQGGDDVQQICEAGKEEFLEIVSLVGMSQKPLHVRRLQKTLQEWVTNPGVFQNVASKFLHSAMLCPTAEYNQNKTLTPSVSNECHMAESICQGSSNVLNLSLNNQTNFLENVSNQWCNMAGTPEGVLCGPHVALTPSSDGFLSPSKSEDESDFSGIANTDSPTSMVTVSETTDGNTESEFILTINTDSSGERQMASPLTDTEYMPAVDVNTLQMCAKNCMKNQKANSVDISSSKHRILLKELEDAAKHPDSNWAQEAVIKKYSAIYGRFDSRRKPGRKLTPHEIAVNSAAAQICLLDKSYLVRREELFYLSRQVLKESGFHLRKSTSSKGYSKKVSGRGTPNTKLGSSNEEALAGVGPPCKMVRFANGSEANEDLSSPINVASPDDSKQKSLCDKPSKLEVILEGLKSKDSGQSSLAAVASASKRNTMSPRPNESFCFTATNLFDQVGLTNGSRCTAQNMGCVTSQTDPTTFQINTSIYNMQQNVPRGLVMNNLAALRDLYPGNMSSFTPHIWPSGTGNPEMSLISSALNLNQSFLKNEPISP